MAASLRVRNRTKNTTSPTERIANVKENCEGKYIKVDGGNGRDVHGHQWPDRGQKTYSKK